MFDILETVEWGMKHFGSIVTNRCFTRRDLMKAIAAGFVESIGEVELCDDDGFTIRPERYREGFRLTDSGIAELERIRVS